MKKIQRLRVNALFKILKKDMEIYNCKSAVFFDLYEVVKITESLTNAQYLNRAICRIVCNLKFNFCFIYVSFF